MDNTPSHLNLPQKLHTAEIRGTDYWSKHADIMISIKRQSDLINRPKHVEPSTPENFASLNGSIKLWGEDMGSPSSFPHIKREGAELHVRSESSPYTIGSGFSVASSLKAVPEEPHSRGILSEEKRPMKYVKEEFKQEFYECNPWEENKEPFNGIDWIHDTCKKMGTSFKKLMDKGWKKAATEQIERDPEYGC